MKFSIQREALLKPLQHVILYRIGRESNAQIKDDNKNKKNSSFKQHHYYSSLWGY